MTRRTTRIAALGAGAVVALGFFSAAPAGASDGAQADATVSADSTTVSASTAEAISETLGLVNQACADASQAGGAATSTLLSEKGISVAASPAGSSLNLSVSLPALSDALPALGSLPLLGSVTSQVDTAEPLKISCSTATDGTGLGLSAAGVDVLVDAIAPGIDISELDIDIPSVDVNAGTTASSGDPGTKVSATAAAAVPGAVRASGLSPSVRASAAAPATTTTTAASASAEPASTSVSAGTLARTGAGVGGLGLLGTALFGGGRLLSLGRRLLRIG